MDTSRVLVAVILSLALIFAYQELVLKRLYPPPSVQKAQQSKAAKGAPTAALASPDVAPSANAVPGTPVAK